jgi:hypothetical protein
MFGGKGLNVGSVEVSVSAKYSGNDLKRLESDLEGAEKAASALDREMDQVGRNSVKSTGAASKGVSGYSKQTDGATRSTKNLNRETGRGTMLMGGLGSVAKTGAAAGFVALAFGLKKSYDEGLEAQKVMAQTKAVLKSTGGAANVTAKDLGKMSTALSNKIAVDDEAIQSAGNLLLTFKNIRNEAGKGNDMFNQTLTATMDMSAAMGQDAKSSAIQLGKALNDPVKGLGALSRVGIQFTEQQKKEIEVLVKKGDTLKAQKLIMTEVMSQFEGSAKSQADPMKRLGVVIGNIAETIGTALIPYINKASRAISKFLVQFQKGKGLGGEVRKVFEDIGTVLKDLWPVLKFIGKVGVWVFKSVLLPAIVFTAKAIKKAVIAIIDTAEWVKTAYGNVRTFFDKLPGRIKSGLSGLGRMILAPFKWAKDKIVSLFDKVIDKITTVIDAVTGAPGKIGDAIGSVGSALGFRQGGRVGPTAGGPQLFVAGEGGKDEWVISQEGNRRSNVGYLMEAASALGIPMFAKGGKPGDRKFKRNLKRSMLQDKYDWYSNFFDYQDRRANLDGKVTAAELSGMKRTKQKMINLLIRQRKMTSPLDPNYHELGWTIKNLKLDLREMKTTAAEAGSSNMAEQINAFNAERFSVLSSFGGNLRSRTPQTNTMTPQGGGGTQVTINQEFKERPTDPHAWTRNIQNEVAALV